MPDKVPFVDLRAQHEEVRAEIDASIEDIINRSSFIGGDYVKNFEREFAEYLDIKEVVAVGNGTDALWLGLITSGVEPGDAVVTVPNTFIATVEAISRCGAHPLFVDIDLDTANMDPGLLREFLVLKCQVLDDGTVLHKRTGKQIKAIVPVHLYGQPADMNAILALAEEFSLPVVEDACQAHGARLEVKNQWVRAGTLGKAAAFSFYPGKNLGAMGDGGAVVTNDSMLAEEMRWLRDHGQNEKYIHVTPHGWNSRLDAIQAAVLSAKLRRLDHWNNLRRRAAARYEESLSDLPLELPVERDGAQHVYHLYVVRTPHRVHLQKHFSKIGIGSGLHYPIPLHLQKAYVYLGYSRGSFPNTEQSAATLLSLPMHPALTEQHVRVVSEACKEVLLEKSVVTGSQ